MDIRKQMMQLWKDTFHDSDSYIDLVFDTYFDPDWIAYHEEDGVITSALMGVPYEFGWTDHKIKGVYLCGLATRESQRRKGIMTSLIKEINDRARERGVAFSFLLPASDGLRKYYYDRGYVNASYLIENRYTKIHDFEREYETLLIQEDTRVQKLKIAHFKSLKISKIDLKNTEEIQSIIRFIRDKEYSVSYPSIRHNEQDIIAIIEDNILSHGDVFISRNKESKITAVAFVVRTQDAIMKVQHLYHSDRCSRYRILQAIKTAYPDNGIVLQDYPEESERSALWGMNTLEPAPHHGDVAIPAQPVRTYKMSAHANPYIMMKFLNPDEIQEFLTVRRNECKYSILVKDPENGKIFKYMADRGVFKKQEVKISDGDVVFSMKQFQEIVCRKPSDDNLVMEAFGIPRFALNLSLLLE